MRTPDRAFTLDSFEPAYLSADVRTSLPERARAAIASLESCRACPRACGVNRLSDQVGLCRTGRLARVCSAFAHHGEEDCLVGRYGSGTIFLARCNLRCVFCQNHDISQGVNSRMPMDATRVAELMLTLQAKGCHNINFVSPSHVVPQLIEAMAEAVGRGLRVPIVYNTNAYDSLETLRALEGLVDIYMPDFKLFSSAMGARYLGAEDYAHRAREAVAEMHRQVGDLHMTPDGVACRGLLVRHLIMPGLTAETEAICRWLVETIARDTFINIMGQYRPAHRVGTPTADPPGRPTLRYAEINRRPTPREIQHARTAAQEAGLWRIDGECFM